MICWKTFPSIIEL